MNNTRYQNTKTLTGCKSRPVFFLCRDRAGREKQCTISQNTIQNTKDNKTSKHKTKHKVKRNPGGILTNDNKTESKPDKPKKAQILRFGHYLKKGIANQTGKISDNAVYLLCIALSLYRLILVSSAIKLMPYR